MSLPLCSVTFLISIPCAAKNPFWMPRSIGSAFAIGSVSTVIVVSCVLLGALAAEPPNNVSASVPAAIHENYAPHASVLPRMSTYTDAGCSLLISR